MKRISLCVMLLILLATARTYSGTVTYSDSWGEQGFTVNESSFTGVKIIYSVNEFSITDQLINNETKSTLQLSGVFLPNDAGAPNLPAESKNIAVPQGASAVYSIKRLREEHFYNIDIAPAPVIPIESDDSPLIYEENEEIYSSDIFYPSSPVQISNNFKIRGLDVVTVSISPFQYNPVSKELVVYRDLEIEVSFNGGNGHFGEDRLRNRHWDRILKKAVINSDQLQKVDYSFISDSETSDFEYLIICPDFPEYVTYANQLKDFRTKQGIRTGVVTLTEIGGNTFDAIETYINNAYNNWTIPPAAVLLLADWGNQSYTSRIFAESYSYYIDESWGTAFAPSDNYYADVKVSDNKGLPEIVISRLPASRESEILTMISKIINYETNPPSSTNFYNNPIIANYWDSDRWFQLCSEIVNGFMKSKLGKNPQRLNTISDDFDLNYWANDQASLYGNTTAVVNYFGPSGRGYIPSSPLSLVITNNGSSTNFINAINTGGFLIQYRGHGGRTYWDFPHFTTSNMASLTNTDLPFVFSTCCLTGQFNYDDYYDYEPFCEVFQNYTFNNHNSGCLGMIAASHVSFSFVNDAYVWGVYDYLWPDFMDDYADDPVNSNNEFLPAFANVYGKIFLDKSSWPYNYYDIKTTNYLFNSFCDPYTNVYTEVPQALTVDYEQLTGGDNYLNVSADIGSIIAIVADGKLIGRGIGTGSLTPIQITPQASCIPITLTVTKQNYYRYETTISTLPDPAILTSDKKFALLIAGDYNAANIPVEKRWNEGVGDNSEFWNDLFLQWEMLYKKGFKPENIMVLFANGKDLWEIPEFDYIAIRYRPTQYDELGIDHITNYSATRLNLINAAAYLKDKINADGVVDEFLYVWVMSHGGSSSQSSLCLIDPAKAASYDEMTAHEFVSIINGIPAYKKYVQFSLNYAQGFLNEFENSGVGNARVEVSSTNTPSHRADDATAAKGYVTENEIINGRTYYHGEFNFHKYTAAMMETQYGNTTYDGIDLQTVDTRDDDFITFDESYSWAAGKISDGSATNYVDFGNISWVPDGYNDVGYYTSFEFPTQIYNNFSNFNPALTRQSVSGHCGVVENIQVSNPCMEGAYLSLRQNSTTTVVGNNSINVQNIPNSESSLNLGNNAILRGENNNKLSFTSSSNEVSASPLNLSGGILDNLDIYNDGQFYITEGGGKIQNSKLENNGSFWLINGILDINNTEIFTGEEKSSLITLGLATGIEDSKEYVDPKIVLSNNSDWYFKGTYEGMYTTGLEINDGSNFTISDNSTFSNLKIAVSEWGIFNYSNLCFLYNSEIYVENGGVLNFTSGNYYNLDQLFASQITAGTNGCIVIDTNSTLNISTEKVFMEAGSSLNINPGSNLVGNYTFPESTKLRTRGDCSVTGDLIFSPQASMSIGGIIIGNLHPETVIKSGSDITFNQADLYIGQGANVIIEAGAVLRLNGPMKVVMGGGAKINYDGIIEGSDVEWVYGYEDLEPDPRKSDELWEGIFANPGGHISISNSNFSDVTTAISGTPDSITIKNCTFTDCVNGINLVECNNFTIENNTLTGIGSGSGITLTQCEGELKENTVSGFSHGIDINSCSPMLSKNKINGNTNYGICILGYNANPQLIDPTTTQSYLNNEIRDNGTAQIFLKYCASAYMTNGRNNIYSGNAGDIPEVPCIFAGSTTVEPAKVALPARTDIDAEYNYWGNANLEDNYTSYFAVWAPSVLTGYRLFYEPYSTVPYKTENQIPDASMSAHEQPDPTSILLSNAIKQELDGNLKPAIKLYENVISRDSTTAEALVALARLPIVYLKEGIATDPVIKLYDDALASDETANKSFYKEMKVSTFLKTKKYDEAITISEEMKAEAETDGEILLAEIDIAIANMLKNAQNPELASKDNSDSITDLLKTLAGNEDKINPAYITEEILPTETILYQNYPNPFNPVTHIRFDIVKAGIVKISVYNINGQKVVELVDRQMKAGKHTVEFDGSILNSGLYYYTLETDDIVSTKKMLIIK